MTEEFKYDVFISYKENNSQGFRKMKLLSIILGLLLIGVSACEATKVNEAEILSPTLFMTSSITFTREPTNTLPPPTSTNTTQPIATARPTISPSITPSVTPTPYPTSELSFPSVLAKTPFPIPQEAISPENADQIQQIARYGKGYINQVAYSSGGGYLAVATSLGVYVYDRSLQEILYLDTVEAVDQIVFSHTSDRLAGVLGNKTIFEWRLADGQVLQKVDGIQAAYSPDGELIIMQRIDDEKVSIQLVETSHQEILRDIDGVRPYLYSTERFVFSYDASFVLVTERLGLDSLEKYALEKEISPIEFFAPWDGEGEEWEYYCSGVTSLAVSRDSEFVAKGCVENGNIFIWRVDGELIQKIGPVSWVIKALVFSPDNRYIAASTEMGSLGIWRISDGAYIQRLPSAFGSITSLAYSPNGEFLVAGYHNGLVRQWNVLDGKIVLDLHDFTPTGKELNFSPEGDRLMTIAGNGVQIIGVQDGAPFQNLIAYILKTSGKRAKLLPVSLQRSGPAGQIDWVSIAPDWRHLITWKDSGTAYLWQMETAKLLGTYEWDENPQLLEEVSRVNPEHGDYLITVNPPWNPPFSPNLNYQIEMDQSGSPGKLLNRETGVRCGPTDFSLDTVFSNDSTMMAVPVGNRIHVYRTEDCSFLHDLGSHFMSVKSLAFSFDDDMLATGSWDGGIMLWDLTSGSLLSSIQGHTGFYHGYFGVDSIISGLAFSPDNRYLASGGFTDGTIRIWGINP